MQNHANIGFENEIEIIFQTICQLEEIFSTWIKNDPVKYGHIVDHIATCKQDFFALLHTNDLPTTQQLNEFEKKLYSGRIFNPKSKKNLKLKKLRHEAVIETAAESNNLDSCDIIWTQTQPTSSTWKKFLNKTKSNAAYVRTPNKLFYLNKQTEVFSEIPLSGFEQILMLPSPPNEIEQGKIGIAKTNWYNKIIFNENFLSDVHEIIGYPFKVNLVDNPPKTPEDIKPNVIAIYKEKLSILDDMLNNNNPQNTYSFYWLEDGIVKKKLLASASKVNPILYKLENKSFLTKQEIQEIISKCDIKLHRTIGIIPTSDHAFIKDEARFYKACWYEGNELQIILFNHSDLIDLIDLLNNNVITDQKIITEITSQLDETISKFNKAKPERNPIPSIKNNDTYTAYWSQHNQDKINYFRLNKANLEDILASLPDIGRSISNDSEDNQSIIEQVSLKFHCSLYKEKLAEFDKVVKLNINSNTNEDLKKKLKDHELKEVAAITNHFHTNQKPLEIKKYLSANPLNNKNLDNNTNDILNDIWPKMQQKDSFVSRNLLQYIQTNFKQEKDKTLPDLKTKFPILKFDWQQNKNQKKNEKEDQQILESYCDSIKEKINFYKEKTTELGNNETLLNQLSKLDALVNTLDSFNKKVIKNKHNIKKDKPSFTANDYLSLIKEICIHSNKNIVAEDHYEDVFISSKLMKIENTIFIIPPRKDSKNYPNIPVVFFYNFVSKRYEYKSLRMDEYLLIRKISYHGTKQLKQKVKDIAFICGIGPEHILYQALNEKIISHQIEIETEIKKIEIKNECLLKKASLVNKIKNVWDSTYKSKMDSIKGLREKAAETLNKVNEFNRIVERLQLLEIDEKTVKSKIEKLSFVEYKNALDIFQESLTIHFNDFEELVTNILNENKQSSVDDILYNLEIIYFKRLNEHNKICQEELNKIDKRITTYLNETTNQLKIIQSDRDDVSSLLLNQFNRTTDALATQQKIVEDKLKSLVNELNVYKYEFTKAQKLWPMTFDKLLNEWQDQINTTSAHLSEVNTLLNDQNLNPVNVDNITQKSVSPFNKMLDTLNADITTTSRIKDKILNHYSGFKQTLKVAVYRENSEIRKSIENLITDSIDFWNSQPFIDNSRIDTKKNDLFFYQKDISDLLKKFNQAEQTLESIQEFKEIISAKLNIIQNSIVRFNRDHFNLMISVYENKLSSLKRLFEAGDNIIATLNLDIHFPRVDFNHIKNLFRQLNQSYLIISTSENGLLVDKELDNLTTCIKNINALEELSSKYKLISMLNHNVDENFSKNEDDFSLLNKDKFFINIYQQMKKDIFKNALEHFDNKKSQEINDKNIIDYCQSEQFNHLTIKWKSFFAEEKINNAYFHEQRTYVNEFGKKLRQILHSKSNNHNDQKLLGSLPLNQFYADLSSILYGKQPLHLKRIALEQVALNIYWMIRKNQGASISEVGNALEQFLNSKAGANLPKKYGPLCFVPHKVYGKPPILSEVRKNSSALINENNLKLLEKINDITFHKRDDQKNPVNFSQYLSELNYFFDENDKDQFDLISANPTFLTPEYAARIRAIFYDLISIMEKRKDKQAKDWLQHYESFYSPQLMHDNEIKYSFLIAYQRLKIKLGTEHLDTKRRKQENTIQLSTIKYVDGQFDLTSVEGIFKAMEAIRKIEIDDKQKTDLMLEVLTSASTKIRHKAKRLTFFNIFNRTKSNLADALDKFINEQKQMIFQGIYDTNNVHLFDIQRKLT